MASAIGAVARWIAPFLTVAAVVGVGLTAESAQVSTAPAVRLAADGNPLAGLPFYVNPKSKARTAADGVDPRSPELDSIANTPTAYWMDHLSTPSVDAKYIADAQAAGTIPVLALYGIKVQLAESSAEAFERITETRPDVLVSDIGLPGEDGYDLIRKIRALDKEKGGATPAIALTGYVSVQDRKLALDAGFQDHIPKPVDPNLLIELLARFRTNGHRSNGQS